jgi:hypothetical protein
MSNPRTVIRSLFLVSALAAGSVTFAGCGGLSEPRDAAAGFVAENDGYGLHYVDTGETAKLAYGRPDSELMSLMLECAKGSGEVEISDTSQGVGEIRLASGGASARFDGAIAPAPIAPILIADTQADTPVLQAFRRTGRVEVANGKLRYAVSGDRPTVERFFAACETTA